MKKINYTIALLSLFLNSSLWAAASDSIQLNQNIDFTCEIHWDADPIASNLDITTSQSHLFIGRLILKANDQVNLNYDLPTEEKLVHSSVPSNFFSFNSLDYENNGPSSGTVNFPISGDYPSGIPGEIIDLWQDHFLNYTGVPALSLIQGTYQATWYASCGPVI